MSKNEKNKNIYQVAKTLIDIFDNDLWSSRISLIGNLVIIFFIIISSLEVIFSSQSSASHYRPLMQLVFYLTSIFFIVEIGLRIWLSGHINPEYRGLKGKFKYLVTFYGVIDLLSVIPFFAILAGVPETGLIKSLKVLRTWRLIRFVPASTTIINAFKKKRNEIFVSLFLIILLSLTVSAFLFYVENRHGNHGFGSILSALVWSIGKYTGDYGGIAHYEPVTMLGQFFATVNGVLGIALFALPAGLLGSAFIDELGEKKSRDNSVEISKLIDAKRYSTLDYIQSKLFYTEEEIIKAIRASRNLRFRAMKSSPELLYNDIKIIECFPHNTSYGYKKLNPSSQITIVNPVGFVERGISHFSWRVAKELGYNYISREYPMKTKKGKNISGFASLLYSNYGKNKKILPWEFQDLRNDLIKSTNESDWVIIFNSAASGRKADFHFTYGNSEGAPDGLFKGSTIMDYPSFERLYALAEIRSKNIQIKKKNKSVDIISFEISQHKCIGRQSDKELGIFLHEEKNANVLTLYVNINILIGKDDPYNAAVGFVADILKETFGSYEKTEKGMNEIIIV